MKKVIDKNENKILEKESAKQFRKEIIGTCITGVSAITIFTLLYIFFAFCNFGYIFSYAYTMIFSFLTSLMLYSFVLAITKKTSKALKICYIIIFILALINQIKLLYTGEPVYFSDIKFIWKSTELLELVTGNISFSVIFKGILIFFIFGLILAGIVWINKKYDIELNNKKIRIGIIIVDIVLLLILMFPTAFTKDIFLKIFFDINNHKDFESHTSPVNYYFKNGVINGMYGIELNNKFFEPKDYDDEALNYILENETTEAKKSIGKPNIILMFSEAFWDVDVLEEIEFNIDVTPNFNELKNEGKFVNLISPIYGGMSENAVFEVVTGGSMNYFPKGYIPIMSLYTKEESKNKPSFINLLKENGYYSKIIFGKDYYDSEKACLRMGYNDYEELDYNTNLFTDKEMVDFVINEFQNKDKNVRNFYTIETIESHMPFPESKYSNYDIEITKSNLTEKQNETLRTYAQGIHNADKELKRLYEYIKTFDEPTILIFLGDHLPFLYTADNENVLYYLEYFHTDDELLNYYRIYNTQSLVLANYDISNLEMPSYLGTDMLLNTIISQMDIEMPEYYKWLYSTSKILPASNIYISLDTSGNKYYTHELEGKMKEVYDLKNLMQYKHFIK